MALDALFTGSSALQAYSSALDVIGNNLANVNTTGFKSQRTEFKDLLYQTVNSGSALAGNIGSVNPEQLGFGVLVGAVDTSFQQGTSNATGKNLDASIQGSGFFAVSDGTRNLYTRGGAFSVDSSGFLVDSNTGFRVQRFGSTGEGSATIPAFQSVGNSNIQIPSGTSVPGSQTANVQIQGNLSASLNVGDSTSTAIQVFDSQSISRTLNVTFTKSAADTFTVAATVSGGTVSFAGSTTATFSGAGLLLTPAGGFAATLNGLPGAQTINLNIGAPGQAAGITQFGGTSTLAATNQDGLGSGTLTTVSIDQSGVIQGVFSNGRTLPVAQLSIASFANPGGLVRQGNNYFGISGASGDPLTGPAGTGGRGTVQSGTLEGSNVDISSEFSNLILAQRGFEANTKTITVADQILQDLTGLIR